VVAQDQLLEEEDQNNPVEVKEVAEEVVEEAAEEVASEESVEEAVEEVEVDLEDQVDLEEQVVERQVAAQAVHQPLLPHLVDLKQLSLRLKLLLTQRLLLVREVLSIEVDKINQDQERSAHHGLTVSLILLRSILNLV
jgi:hypothetical protein